MIEFKPQLDKADRYFTYLFGATYEELKELRAVRKFYKVNNVQNIFDLDYTDRILLDGVKSYPTPLSCGVA